jgi:hypothetical protein
MPAANFDRLKDAFLVLTVLWVSTTLATAASPNLGAIRPVGAQRGTETASGISELRTFSVGALKEVTEVEPNNDFAAPQAIPMNVTVTGVTDNEDMAGTFLVALTLPGKAGERRGDQKPADVQPKAAAPAPTAGLASIRFSPDEVNLTTARDRQSFVVQATYADGIMRDITKEAAARAAAPQAAAAAQTRSKATALAIQAAREAVKRAEGEKAAAEKNLADAKAAAGTATANLANPKKNLEQASAAKAAAEKTLAEKTCPDRRGRLRAGPDHSLTTQPGVSRRTQESSCTRHV